DADHVAIPFPPVRTVRSVVPKIEIVSRHDSPLLSALKPLRRRPEAEMHCLLTSRVNASLSGSDALSSWQCDPGAITSVGRVWSPAFRRLGVRIHTPWKGGAPGRLKAGLQT